MIIVQFQKEFKGISQKLRKCNFPEEGSLKLFDYYTRSNCELECAWTKAAEICGCKPWHVPALDGEETCFVLGNVCFDQIMNKIKSKKMNLTCDCEEDCIYSRYTLSMKEDVILERTSTDVHFQTPGFYTMGTDELHGTDFATTHWFNMGKQNSKG